ncbi:hypothetical protein AC579_3647 [Lecanosticta acicola]|uniref:DUF1275 domain protein n=1 Tax=Lecanosticta acicola TaxID=111012 RepID=A0AAI8YY00_9PEZI|nr:hypothetical protein AC579_3647 [Lecanosticta acicola]
MSLSPPQAITGPPSPGPSGYDRSVTVPQLAAALGQQAHLQAERRQHSIHEQGRASVDTVSSDKLNDLGPEDTPKSYDGKEGASQSGKQFGSPPTPTIVLPTSAAWKTYFMQEVAGDKYLGLQLLLMTVSTGILDAMTYASYNVFASKQTGNTLFLALYAFRVPGTLNPGVEQNVGVSMGVFIAGAIFFGHIGHFSRQQRRIWLLISNAFQALLMLAAAAIRYFYSRNSTGPGALAILALLSFAESGQIANALNVAMPELNTTMVTGALIQLCTDKNFFALKNAKRNRRLAFYASMLTGCFIGAALLKYSSPSAALVVCAATKGLLFVSFFCNRGLVEKRFGLEDGREKSEGTVTPASRVLWGD